MATSARLPGMAFGQQSGPPASAKQVKELLTLLKNVGHTDLRDARGPMGFTQRQAAGKFTRDEATGFIDRHLVLLVQAFDAQGKPLRASTGPKLDVAASSPVSRSIAADAIIECIRARAV